MDERRQVNRWPFEDDADRDDPLTALRIAVSGPWARWCYLVTFDRESQGRPTDAEAAMLASFLEEYKHRWYNPGFLAKLSKRDLDVDGGANGITFHKSGEDDWAFNRRSWMSGPLFVPPRHGSEFGGSMRPLALEPLMDYINTIAGHTMEHWLQWKATHPDVFSSATSLCPS